MTASKVAIKGFTVEIDEIKASDGQPIAVTRYGKPGRKKRGVPVVLVHGLGQNRYTWHCTRLHFPAFLVDKGFDVFVPELRGHGLSRAAGSFHPSGFTEYVYKDMPAIFEWVRKATGGKKMFFCGHSLGGTIGYALDPKEHEHLKGMVFFASPYHFGKGLFLLTCLARILETGYSITPIKLIDLLDRRTGFPVDLFGRFLALFPELLDTKFNLFPYQGWYPGSIDRDVLEERLLLGFDRTSTFMMRMMVVWAAKGRLLDEKGSDVFEKNTVAKDMPLLFLTGDRDCLVPAESVSDAYNLAVSNDKTWKVFSERDNGTHWGHLDMVIGRMAPFEVWPYVCEWMKNRV